MRNRVVTAWEEVLANKPPEQNQLFKLITEAGFIEETLSAEAYLLFVRRTTSYGSYFDIERQMKAIVQVK